MKIAKTLLAALFTCLLAMPVAQAQEPKKEEKPEAKKEEKKKGLPLKTERKIEFTTDEGTWISLDVSPDGKTILFELLGDLYTMPMSGGEAKRLPVSDSAAKDGSTLAFDSMPRYSPDGKWIAFLSDRDGADNVWIAKADGTEPKQLSKDQQSLFVSPDWTHDSQYVTVSRATPASGTAELWMYHIQGGSGVQVTKAQPQPNTLPPQRLNVLGAVASPDGKYFYYARKQGGFAYNMMSFPWQIARRDRKTGDEDTLTSAEGGAFRPVLSPDGTKLVYGTRYETQTGLRIRDLNSGEDRWLKYPVQHDDMESRATRDLLNGYAFTPDGKEVVASYGGKIHRVNVTSGDDREVAFTAKVSQDVGPLLNFPIRVDESPVRARILQGPVQSPDGKRVAFSAVTHLYVMDLPGGKPARVTKSEAREFQPTWSPDGQWLAYVTWSVDGGHIWKTRADGNGQPQQLTKVAAFYREPAWSPDGTRIVALRAPTFERVQQPSEFGGRLVPADIIWIPAEGGDSTLIVPARGTGKVHFTHEKDRLYVHSPGGLISMRFDGTDRRSHVRVVGKSFGPEPSPAQEVRISPDGTHAVALVANQLWVVTVPPPVGEMTTVNVNSPSVPVKKLTDVGADYIAWADDGATITWGLGASFFRQPLASVSFEAEKKDEKETKDAKKEGEEVKEVKEAKEKKKPLYEETEIALEFPRHKPQGTAVLRGAKIITMKGDEVIENGDIVITDNRITAVGARGKVTIPAGAKVFDVKGATIMPGIVDVHAHWEVRNSVLELPNWSYLANLAYGVTTGRDPQTATNDQLAYQDLVEMGEMLGPRVFSTGPGVFSNNDFQSAEEAKNVIEKYKKYYRTNTLKSYMVGNRKQREWVVEACKELGISPTTEGGLDLKLNLTHALDGMNGNEHALPIVPLYKDVAETFARTQIHYTPTLLVAYGGPWAENYFYETTDVHGDTKLRRFIPHNELDDKSLRRPWFSKEQHIFPRLAEGAAKIVHAGGFVQIGGHGQLQGIQCHWEMWALKEGGLTNMEVLRAATIRGAEAIGFAQDLGSIEAGKLADLIVLNKDPLVEIHNTNTIRYVMKDGELFEGDTLNQMWPAQKKLPAMWWWNDKPEGGTPAGKAVNSGQ